VVGVLTPAVARSDGQVRAGAAGGSDGTYPWATRRASMRRRATRGYGDVDPNDAAGQETGVVRGPSRESVRALVVRGGDGRYIALLSDDHYIPQDALWRRTAQLLTTDTGGLINEKNLTMA